MNTLLPIALNNIFFATALAMIAVVVNQVWKNHHVAHLMWVIVLAKFIMPPLWNVPIHVPEFSEPRSAPTVANRDVLLHATAGNRDPHEPDRSEVASVTADRTSLIGQVTSENQDALVEPQVAYDQVVPEIALANRGEPNVRQIFLRHSANVLATAWLLSSLVCAVIVTIRVVRFRQMAGSGQPADLGLVLRVEQLAAQFGLRNSPDVRLLNCAISPMVWPLAWRRMLLLPRRLVDELTPAQLDTVIAHELAHLVRRDEWVRFLETVVTCLFWWNPLVWFARRELRAAEELCCDALVVCSLPELRQQYGTALLRTAEMICLGRSLPDFASAFAEPSHLKRRIEMILNHKYPRVASWQARVLLLVLSASVLPLATTGMSQDRASPETSSPSTHKPVPETGLSNIGPQEAATVNLAGASEQEGGPDIVSQAPQSDRVLDDTQKPTLGELVRSIERHEATFTDFYIKLKLEWHADPETSESDREDWSLNEARRVLEYARRAQDDLWLEDTVALKNGNWSQRWSDYSDGIRVSAVQESADESNRTVDLKRLGEEIDKLPDAVEAVKGLFYMGSSLSARIKANAFDTQLDWDNEDAKITLTFDPAQKLIVWMSRQHGWFPVHYQRFVVRDGQSELREEWQVVEFRQIDGVDVPVRGEHHWSEGDWGNSPSHSVRFEVEDFRMERLPVDRFQYRIPEGSYVRDRETGREFWLGDRITQRRN